MFCHSGVSQQPCTCTELLPDPAAVPQTCLFVGTATPTHLAHPPSRPPPPQHYCLATNVIGSEARGTMKRAVAALKAGYEVPIFPLLDRCK